MKNLSFLCVLMVSLVMGTASVKAGILPQDKRQELAQALLKQFWGNARLPDGSVIQPGDEQDRATFPVSGRALSLTFDAAEVSGLAEWCGLDWQRNFFAMMASARRGGVDDRQAAFIATLHGFVSTFMENTMKSRPCSGEIRTKTEAMLNASISRLQK